MKPRTENQCWACRASCNNDCVGPDRWSERVSALGPAVRHEALEASGGVRETDRTGGVAGSWSKGLQPVWWQLPGSRETDWQHNKNAILENVHAFPRLKVQRRVDSGCSCRPAQTGCYDEDVWNFSWFSCALINCFCYLLASAHCAGAAQVSPAVLLSLTPCLSLSPIFPSLTCVISFFTPTSLPPPSINLQCFLLSQLFFTSIPLFWLHPSNYSSSPLYPWKSNILSFFSPSHLHFCSLSFWDSGNISTRSQHLLFASSPHFSQTPVHVFHFSSAPSIQTNFLLANCPTL